MAYEDELDKTLELNLVVNINGDFYAIKEPDSGLSITSEYLQVKLPRINGVTVDVRSANSPISTFSFQLMEFEGNKTSSKIMLDDTQFLEKDLIAYVGHITGSFDFSDYIEIARTKITKVTKIANGYSIISKEVSNLIAQPALFRNDISTTAIIPASTTIDITDTTDWRPSGLLKVDNEFMAYSGLDINGTTITGLTRGIFGSTAVEHEVGATVYQVTEFNAINPVDILLQILLSNEGNGANDPTYDVIEQGLGIDPANIDITDFETTRDTDFIGELHSLLVYGADNMLKYLEKFLLPSTNLRFVTLNGKIGISLLDQVDFNEAVQVIDESSIRGTPTWGLTSDKVVNVIVAQYDYNFSTGNYATIQRFTDPDSIATFGEKKELKLNMPSVTTGQNGSVIATERANRLLGRLSTARGKVTLTCHFDKSNIAIGSNVQVVHRYLPQQGGTLGFSDQLEVMSRSIDLTKALVTYKLEFTSYTGIRIPFIAPSPKIVSIVDQSTIEVDDAACLAIGERHLLFKDGDLDGLGNPTAGGYLPDSVHTIESILGNIVTFTAPWTTTLELGLWLKLTDYDEATDEQKAKYAFIGENTGFFNDDSKSYQIIF